MLAAVLHARRDLRVEQVPGARAPRAGEVVLDVVRAAICGTDASEWDHGPVMSPLERRHPVTRHLGPVVLGHEFVGIVRDAADDVTGLAPGDRVVPGCGVWCGRCLWCRAGRTQLCRNRYLVGMHSDGGLAEAAVVPAAMCKPVAADCSDDAAAIAQPLAVAVHGLNRGRVHGGSLVVIGAGGIGAFVVAAAHRRGVSPLIVVDIDAARLERARELGADHAFLAGDPGLKDAIHQLTGGDGPEVVCEASGAPTSPALAADLARPGGRVLVLGMQARPCELDLFTLTQWEIEIVPSNAHVCDTDLAPALEHLATTDLADRVIGARIGLDRLVPDGLELLASGRAPGKIVVDPWS